MIADFVDPMIGYYFACGKSNFCSFPLFALTAALTSGKVLNFCIATKQASPDVSFLIAVVVMMSLGCFMCSEMDNCNWITLQMLNWISGVFTI